MFAQGLEQLPQEPVRRILLLRTAAAPQVQWTIEQLKASYPDATFWVLGTQLHNGNSGLFDGMHKMQVVQQWIGPRSIRQFRRTIRDAGFDLAVMCLNSHSWAGYEQVSRVMKSVPARMKLVAAYTREWSLWRHDLFQDGNKFTRFAAAGLELLLLPLVFAVVALMPGGRTYMPEGQGRVAPEYDR
jgi:hypothetical protein